jgi:prepilin-type N-terminal cleavage/methylation domain-containing protein
MATVVARQRTRGGNARGFTLLEVLIVLVLIAIMLAVAIPLMRRSQAAANEASAIKSLRTLYQTQAMYRLQNSTYATLADLGAAGNRYLDDPAFARGEKSGYRFAVTVDSESWWHAVATPAAYGSDGTTTYYIDETNTLRGADLGKSDPSATRDVGQTWRPVN